MDELIFLSAAELARRVKRRKISPVEVLDAHLRRIAQVNAKLNAFVRVDEERARDAAKRAESAAAKAGAAGALLGVPLTIKSSIEVAGLPSDTGSKLRAGYVPPADAPLVARLRAAGAVILGNTNVPEMLMAYETDNLLHGRTNNPWDLARTPGGSSGGEAAAIASGCSAGGFGSDGGGSVRVPAHFCGICALKPTPGRVPTSGSFPLHYGPFNYLGVAGPLARTVEDLRLLFEAAAGYDDRDSASAPAPVRWPALEEVRRLRVGFFEDDGNVPVTPATRVAVRNAVEALRRDGFDVQPFRPEGLAAARAFWWELFGHFGFFLVSALYAGRESEQGPLLAEGTALIRSEPPLTLERLAQALVGRDALRERFLAQMEQFPILLCPVCAIPAFRHRERSWDVDGKRARYLQDPDVMSYAQWFNLLGNPAAAVPVAQSPEDLPIGVQVVGRPFEDECVLEVAERIEQACGGYRRPPI